MMAVEMELLAVQCSEGKTTSTAVSESGRIQPSKRRTNGKKTNPLIHKITKLLS